MLKMKSCSEKMTLNTEFGMQSFIYSWGYCIDIHTNCLKAHSREKTHARGILKHKREYVSSVPL